MIIEQASIPDIKFLVPKRHEDRRGSFSETWSKRTFEAAGLRFDWVQENQVLSHAANVVRGLHFQREPQAQDKLVRVLKGTIFDVAVDLRRSSSTYGKHVATTLNADEGVQILIPAGFAHGYCTLEPDTDVLYKVSAFYAPELEGGLLWNDPQLEIDWPVSAAEAIVTERDAAYPTLAKLGDVYR